MGQRSKKALAKLWSRRETIVSPWVRLIDKEVSFTDTGEKEIYHCFSSADYVGILAQTTTGLIPLIRQYRPAVETYTWELPAGLLDPGEDPKTACIRELKEEAGIEAQTVYNLGSYFSDTGRLENRSHSFFVKSSDPDPAFEPEPGLSVEFVDIATLKEYIFSGKFKHQLHLGVLTIAILRGFIDLKI
jgi:ADP-ribose pyrophosphatase